MDELIVCPLPFPLGPPPLLTVLEAFLSMYNRLYIPTLLCLVLSHVTYDRIQFFCLPNPPSHSPSEALVTCERRPVNSDLCKNLASHSAAHLPSLFQSLLIRAAALAVD